MEHERDQANRPADALRREAGPAPDFDLVRPFVVSVVAPDAGPPRSLVTADSPDATQEMRLPPMHAPVGRPIAPDAPAPRRSLVVPMIALAGVVLLAIVAGVYDFVTPGTPAAVSLPPPPAIAIPALSSAARSASASPATSPSAHPHPRSTEPSVAVSSPVALPPPPSPSVTFAGIVPSPVPSFSPVPTTPVTGQITGIFGMCVDDNGRVTPNGNPIQVFTCNGTPAQVWTFQPDATVQVLGKCLDVTKPAVGGLIQLWDCNGDAAEIWRVGTVGSIVNVASGLCLEDPNANPQAGTQLDLATCTGAADESWSTPV